MDGLKGQEVNADQIFDGCKSGKSFFRLAGGMAWKSLWEMIWSLLAIAAAYIGIIPVVLSSGVFSGFYYRPNVLAFVGSMALWLVVFVVGLVPAIYKSYEYRFTPYILITRPDVNATAALRLSKEMTKGKKGQMFLADLVFVGVVFILNVVLAVFGAIPFIGILFKLISLIVSILYSLFAPIFTGLYQAAFFELPVQPQNPYANPVQTQIPEQNV